MPKNFITQQAQTAASLRVILITGNKIVNLYRSFFSMMLLVATFLSLDPGVSNLRAGDTQSRAQESSLFEFHNGFWINLHHFLRGSALWVLHPNPEMEAEPQPEFINGEKDKWNSCLDYYKTHYAEKDLTFDAELQKIKNWLGDAENDEKLTDPLDPDLAAILSSAAPIYKKYWWPAHKQSNQKWIDATQRLVSEFGSSIAPRIANAYKKEWPAAPIRVDVTIEAGWAGAYSTIDPLRITVAGADPRYQEYAGLEMLFHETSHGWGHYIYEILDMEATKQHQTMPKDLWHVMIFYTAGEITRQQLQKAGIAYTPFAYMNGVYQRGWQDSLCMVEKDWQPYLDEKVTLEAALENIIRDGAGCRVRPQ